MAPVLHYLRLWDFAAAQRVDHFITQNRNVAQRIRKWYGRKSTVIPSPIDATRFKMDSQTENYYLIVSRLEPYKRLDLAIEAFNHLGLPLWIVGDGSDRARLQQLAKPNIKFLGFVPEEQLIRAYARCQALIFPGEEDFGLAPLEASASGRPVIAYAGGGALETVIEGATGVFFRAPTSESLAQAVKDIDIDAFAPTALRAHALKFDKVNFKERILAFVSERLKDLAHSKPGGIE
jgi:glycosyltransferase involved in cell wall biosynthesis